MHECWYVFLRNGVAVVIVLYDIGTGGLGSSRIAFTESLVLARGIVLFDVCCPSGNACCALDSRESHDLCRLHEQAKVRSTTE